MSLFFAIAALVFGAGSFAFGDPAGMPVLGLALAAAGWLRESRGLKRGFVFGLLALATLVCAYATFISLRLNAR